MSEDLASEGAARADAVLALVGGQTLPILLPLADHPALPVVLISSAQTSRQAANLQSALVGMGRRCSIAQVDPYDVSAIRASIAGVASEFNSPVVNLTGGTKMMSLAAFIEAQGRGWSWEYVVTERDQVITSTGQHPLEARHLENLTLDVYLKAAGLRVHPNRPGPRGIADLDRGRVKAARILGNNRKMREWLTAWGRGPGDVPPPYIAGEMGNLRPVMTQMFVDNSWLEIATAAAAHDIGGRDVRIGMSIVSQEATDVQASENEVDVVFTYRGRLVMLECKAGLTWPASLIRERQAIGYDLGGKYAITGFVLGSTRPLRGARVTRARERGIFVGTVGPHLMADLKNFLEGAAAAL